MGKVMERYWGEKKVKPIRKTAGEVVEKHISVQDNKIYFYSSVNRNACSELNKKVSELETIALTLSNTLDIEKPPILPSNIDDPSSIKRA